MSRRNIVSFFFLMLSFCFLIPGVYLSMLTIKTTGSLAAPEIEAKIGVHFFDTSNSVLQTVKSLFNNHYKFVACVILLFSVIVPIIKGVLFLLMLFYRDSLIKNKIYYFIKNIGKWSMCDVFIVAIFLSYLSSGARSHGQVHNTTISGYEVKVKTLFNMTAHLEIGFYCFFAYCLLSLIALEIYREPH